MTSIDIGLAFVEGLALIVSPCILPVLPLVLATSVDGGRRRPYGIVIGFMFAFSLFAIVARKIISLFGVDLDLLRDMSLVLLALFGLVLLSSRLSRAVSALMQQTANFGAKFASTGDGLFDGILIGSLIGLVWTPCAGPILAAALVQVIRQETDLTGVLVVVSFSLGAGVPMLAISVMGKRIVGRLQSVSEHAEAMRRTLGVLILSSVAFIAYGVDVESLLASSSTKTIETPRTERITLQNALTSPYNAPEFAGIEAWFNSKTLTVKELKGKVVLIDFWTYSCVNCVRTLPFIADLDRRYRDLGLVVIGVHSPEFEFEKKPDNVRAAIVQHDIHYPVALDNHLDTWSNFENRSWPARYLIDRDGRVVYTHFGEGAHDVTEDNIRYLLDLRTNASPTGAESPRYLTDLKHKSLAGESEAGEIAIQASTAWPTKKILNNHKRVSFKDCPDCPDMVVIPAGTFEMGSSNGAANEKPVHRVTFSKAFAMSRTEVTQGQWKAIMGRNPSWFKKCGSDCPVEQVRWIDTQQFIQTLNAKTGKRYRLPSEAEWEYACRAGGKHDYCGSDDADRVAWFNNNSDVATHVVAGKQANAFGLYDMSGNVWEWVEDNWHEDYRGAPSDGSAWTGVGSRRALRGGSWIGDPQVERATRRDWNEFTARIGAGGFRLVSTN